MPTITVSQHFECDQNTAFDTISDFPNAADFVEGIIKVEMLTDGPVGVGTRVRETRIMMGRQATEEMEITQLTKPSKFVVEAFNHGTQYISTYSVEPDGDGTKVTWEFKVTPVTFMAKIMAGLFSRMFGNIADMLQKDLIASSVEAKRRATASN